MAKLLNEHEATWERSCFSKCSGISFNQLMEICASHSFWGCILVSPGASEISLAFLEDLWKTKAEDVMFWRISWERRKGWRDWFVGWEMEWTTENKSSGSILVTAWSNHSSIHPLLHTCVSYNWWAKVIQMLLKSLLSKKLYLLKMAGEHLPLFLLSIFLWVLHPVKGGTPWSGLTQSWVPINLLGLPKILSHQNHIVMAWTKQT